MSAENEAETPRGGIADREDESALRHELARLRQRVLELEAAQVQAGQSRVALLNALEDAVAAQRRAETATVALQHGEERLQLILDSAEDFAIFTLNRERRITSWNRGAELIFGYGPEEARSCRGDILFTPEDQARGAPSAEADQALTEGKAENERWHVRRDGSRFYGSGVTRPLRIGMNVVGFVKALRDLTPWVTADTARREAEEALRESGERIRRALAIETVGVVFFRLRGNIVAANGAFARMSGYTEEQLRVLGPWESLLIHDEHFDVAALKSDLESRGHAAPFETQLSRQDGRRWWALISPTRLSSSGPNPECVAFVVDISSSKETQAALEQALAETDRARTAAESAARAKDQFLAILSHELRTPLTPVLIASHMLLRQAELSENTRDLLESIQRNVQTEAQLVDDLLDVTRIAHGKLEISLTPLNLHEVLTKAIGISESDIEGKQQRLREDISAALDTFVMGDSRRLQQAFWNLLKNASKFTPHAGELSIRCRVESDTAIVQISDSGIGFDSEAAERIFSEFEQANRLVTQEYGGLGLGLGISKAAVEAHGGSIRGESRGPGKGATFSVTLPLLKQ